MHDKRRAVLESHKATFQCLESPRLRGIRIAQQNRIIELNDLTSGRDQRRNFMANRIGVVEGELLSITAIVFIGHAIGDGARSGKAYFGDALRMLPREQKLIEHQRLFVAQLPNDTRGVLRRGACAHRDRLAALGIDTVQTIDDMQHIVPAAFFAVGHDVDAGAILVVDGVECSLVQQSRKFG